MSEATAPAPATDPPLAEHEKSERVVAPEAEEPEKSEEEKHIENLANTLEVKIAAHGERGLECAPAYVEYARALLRKAQAEGDPLGGAIKKEEDAPSGGPGPSAPADDDGEDAEEGDEEEEGESDDLELSFQCFEVARLIYEEAGDSHAITLADVLESLGEVAMENEMCVQPRQPLPAPASGSLDPQPSASCHPCRPPLPLYSLPAHPELSGSAHKSAAQVGERHR